MIKPALYYDTATPCFPIAVIERMGAEFVMKGDSIDYYRLTKAHGPLPRGFIVGKLVENNS